MSTQIKKGDRFICIKDVVMTIGDTAYKAGKVYECKSKEKLGFNLPSEIFSTHTWDLNDGLFNEHFIRDNWQSLYNHLMSLAPAKAWTPFQELWDRYRKLMPRMRVTDPDTQHELTVEEIRAKEADRQVRTDMVNDPVNNPSHYTTGRIEVIDFIEDQKFNYHLGNAIKYISRAGKKDPDKTVQDLQKAVWYVQREIARLGGGSSCE